MDSWFREHIDFVTLGLTMALCFIGGISVYSATYDAGASAFFNRQIIWTGAGFVLLIAATFVPFRTLQLVSYPIYVLALLLLVAVLIAGKTVAGSTSWFGVQGLGLQPSEIGKAATILALASFLSNRAVNLHKMKDILKTSSFALAPVALIILQPDTGTAIIYLGSLLFILYWAGASNFFVLSIIAPAAAAIASLFGITAFLVVIVVTFVILFLLRENRFYAAIVFSLTVLVGISVQFIFGKLLLHQQKRILTFMNPDADPLGAGYNVIQSKIAIGSGGFLGKGFLQGSQTQLNFLPAQWTDFIFCVPSEEFGFLGACLILILMTGLLLRGVHLASTVKSRYASIVAIGIVAVWGVHFIINIGMSMGMVPVIGVPLPFLSYGGSSMMTNMLMAGILMNMYANRKEY
jgi:rod shape determining protein RodA